MMIESNKLEQLEKLTFEILNLCEDQKISTFDLMFILSRALGKTISEIDMPDRELVLNNNIQLIKQTSSECSAYSKTTLIERRKARHEQNDYSDYVYRQDRELELDN